METPLADAPGLCFGAFWVQDILYLQRDKKVPKHICPQSGLERGWRSAIHVPGPQGPRPDCPRGRKGVGSATKALGMQVCRSVLTGIVTPLHPEMWLTCFPTEPSWWLMPLFVPPEDRGLPNPGSCLSTG